MNDDDNNNTLPFLLLDHDSVYTIYVYIMASYDPWQTTSHIITKLMLMKRKGSHVHYLASQVRSTIGNHNSWHLIKYHKLYCFSNSNPFGVDAEFPTLIEAGDRI